MAKWPFARRTGNEETAGAEPVRQAPRLRGNRYRSNDQPHTAKLEKQNRFLSMQAGMMFGFSICATTAFLGLFPLVRHEVQFVHWGDARDRVVTVRTGHLSMTDREALTQDYLARYVEAREAIDHITEPERDRIVRAMTERRWYELWQGQVALTNKDSPRLKWQKAGLTREIKVITVLRDPITTVPGATTYRINFVAIDRLAGQAFNGAPVEKSRVEWVATLALTYRQVKTEGEMYRMNPLGIVIANYTQEARSEPTK